MRQAIVLFKVVERPRRAVALEIGRRGAEHAPHGRDLACNEARIGKLGDADRDVVAFADDVDEFVGEHEIDRRDPCSLP
jgi:hypothetical protein